jgi:hypothetical protein
VTARLIDRQVMHFAGKTYVRHRYTNGHLWMIVANGAGVTARLIAPGTDSPHHHLHRG